MAVITNITWLSMIAVSFEELIGMRENRHLYHLVVREDAAGQGLARQRWDVARKRCLDKGNAGKFTVNLTVTAAGDCQNMPPGRCGFKRY
ncbi:GNAT family N-acetyltransferase [Shewanella algae]|uniref:GNAT family N-acetyltransferase n=1 Tax=Shewanella algae TaxID=38313 RepID=UPI001AAD5C6C|nr:GNAT family N-acetyltransferase [Shewanella algae]QTE84727.1 GNAT family N-acetyltransferase [Shewanella algae]